MEKKITPVLLGADLNCYCVARAFHEKYGVVTEAFGRYAVGATDNSKIVNFHVVKDLDDPSTAVRVLRDFASEHEDETLILLGCTDDYAALIIDSKDQLNDRFFVPYSNRETADRLADKA
ncbi:MAG: carboxylate--amine ligase, partial [Clostridia bacterium]|nr:carboxylate--amine ligase [Clostridia bacterium]